MHHRSQGRARNGTTAVAAIAAILSMGLVMACTFGVGPFGAAPTGERIAVYAP